MKRVLVSGAGGFLARHFTAFLQGRGVEVAALGRATHPELDLTKPEAWVAELERAQPDAVLHLAGCMSSPDIATFYRVNVGFAAALFEALRRSKYPNDRPVLLMSSAAEIGNAPEGERPIPETAPLRPLGHYGVSKVAQTELGLLESRSRAVTIARVFNLVGPGMPTSLALGSFAHSLAALAKRGKSGQIRTGNLGAVRDYIDARDAARLCWALLLEPRARGQVTNVASGIGIRMDDALTQLIAISGLEVQRELDPARMKAADVPFSIGSTERLSALLGPLALIPFETSLRAMYDAARAAS
jgi:nucleoside-diphosphate-sugar epimerase